MVVLRVVAGVVMLAHGIRHARGRAKTSRWFASIGFRMPELQWFASTVTEVGVGVLLIVGFGTSLAIGGPGELSVDAVLGIDAVLGGWAGLALAAGGAALAAAQIATFFHPRINAEA